MKISKLVFSACLAIGLAGFTAVAPARSLEKTDVTIAVGGQSSPNYLPLTAAQRLGYFKDAGLNVTINNFNSGSKSIQALVGGSVDAAVGYFDHVIYMQAKGQPIYSVVQLGMEPALVLAVRSDLADKIKTPKDLAGHTVGVTGPGSSTEFLLRYILERQGANPNSAKVVGVGVGQSVIAAVDHKQVDAIVQVEPVITMLTQAGKIKVMVDTRTEAGTEEAYGGPYPAAVLMLSRETAQKYPHTTQALVTALVRTLKWLHNATPEQIVDLMPTDYQLDDKNLYTAVISHYTKIYSPTGVMQKASAETALKVLSDMVPSVKDANIDIGKTYDNSFAKAADEALAQ